MIFITSRDIEMKFQVIRTMISLCRSPFLWAVLSILTLCQYYVCRRRNIVKITQFARQSETVITSRYTRHQVTFSAGIQVPFIAGSRVVLSIMGQKREYKQIFIYKTEKKTIFINNAPTLCWVMLITPHCRLSWFFEKLLHCAAHNVWMAN